MTYETIDLSIDAGVATVLLNRPEIRNAFDDKMVAELSDAFASIEEDESVNVVVLTGSGSAFSAGADLNWMRRMAGYDFDENYEDSIAMGRMFNDIAGSTRLVIGRINGPAVGGGVGLVAVCDLVIASINSRFRFSEVKLGIVPAVISPHVIRRIGPTAAVPLFTEGGWLDAHEALRLGLVDLLVPDDLLDDEIERRIRALRSSGPQAIRHAKALVKSVERGASPEEAAELIARLRASDEGSEGISSFLEKRRPDWRW